jgi:NitT/TauT family transport system permease protein
MRRKKKSRRRQRGASEAPAPPRRTLVTARTWPFVIDVGVAACGLAIFFAIVSTGTYWLGKPVPVVPISHSISALPALRLLLHRAHRHRLPAQPHLRHHLRLHAAYNPRVEAWMIAVLDILQSIPVLSFLPPVVLAMVALVPGHQLGIEMGVILLIFTGQVWNLAFSFYSSLKSIPREMLEASRIYRYSAWQRFWQLEMPYAAIGLVWNSIVSVAGGWFALMACEMFTMGTATSSFPASAATSKPPPTPATSRRPRLRHRRRHPHRRRHRSARLASAHRLERQVQIRAGRVRRPRHLAHPRTAPRSTLLSSIPGRIWTSIEEPIYRRMARTKERPHRPSLDEDRPAARLPRLWTVAIARPLRRRLGSLQAVLMLRTVTWPDLKLLLEGAGATFLRVNAALLISAALDHPRRRRHRLQPQTRPHRAAHAQVLASVPATAFFPILLIGLVKIGGGLGIGSIALMLLGTQWYILFNVIAGAMSIPSDLREVSSLYHFTRWQRWTTSSSPASSPTSSPAWSPPPAAPGTPPSSPNTPTSKTAPSNHRPRRADRRRHRQRPLPHPAARHHPDLADGRHHEPPGLAPPLPPRRNPL